MNAISKALEIAIRSGGVDGSHHKMWTIDQMVRALTGCPIVKRDGVDAHGHPYSYEAQGESGEYKAFLREYSGNEDEYVWDEGIAP
jgi:hypothetical protein